MGTLRNVWDLMPSARFRGLRTAVQLIIAVDAISEDKLYVLEFSET